MQWSGRAPVRDFLFMVALSAVPASEARDAAAALADIIATQASATHPHLCTLASLDNADDARNASDALHHLSMLHGRHPGVIDHAATKTTDNEARLALFAMADGFAQEREILSRLVVAAGPIPSTPGQAETEASVVHQRHALEMLAQSDRQGCALGAAIAVALDWRAMNGLIAASGRRFGVDFRPSTLADDATLVTIARAACTSPAIERAMLFGAQQIATQHHGLWDLLEARARARIQH